MNQYWSRSFGREQDAKRREQCVDVMPERQLGAQEMRADLKVLAHHGTPKMVRRKVNVLLIWAGDTLNRALYDSPTGALTLSAAHKNRSVRLSLLTKTSG